MLFQKKESSRIDESKQSVTVILVALQSSGQINSRMVSEFEVVLCPIVNVGVL
jgi:hypothetical protein